MLPYGKRDRPTYVKICTRLYWVQIVRFVDGAKRNRAYATASPGRAKEVLGLVLIDFLVNGL